MEKPPLPQPLDLNNIVSLSPEKRLLPILTWLSECEAYLLRASPEDVSNNQQSLQHYLLNILSLPTPRLGHVLRRTLGRCLAYLFERGDRKVLFDTVSTLAQKTSQLKGDKDAKQKQYILNLSILLTSRATIQCLGSVLAVAGDSIGQLLPDIVSSLSKIVRTSHSEPGLRATTLACLRDALLKHSTPREESVSRELWKAAKVGLMDKSWITQMKALEVSCSWTTLIKVTRRDLSSIACCIRFRAGNRQNHDYAGYGYTVYETPKLSRPNTGLDSARN